MTLKEFNKFDKNDKKSWRLKTKALQKQLKNDNEFIIYKRKQISKSEKSEIWDISKTNQSFDSRMFRQDILNNVIIKHIRYTLDNENKVFAGEYEHFISHSNGGESSPDNICLLNAGINRSKGSKEVFKLDFYEKEGLQTNFGMSFNRLLELLNSNLHNTCKKYNLIFILIGDIWSIKTENGGYMPYNDHYHTFPMNVTIKDSSDLLIRAAISLISIEAIKCTARWFYRRYFYYKKRKRQLHLT